MLCFGSHHTMATNEVIQPGYAQSATPSASPSGQITSLGPKDGNVSAVYRGSAEPANIFEAYFGPAPAGFDTSGMNRVARTNLQLPAYYQGRNLYLERIISWGVADVQDWPTTAFLPLLPYDGLTFSWSKMQNTPHILDRVPEEAASRLVTTTFEMSSASSERYGLAFRMEHGLLGTPMGEKMWTSNIKAIVQATMRTINLAIMQLAVHQEPYINALCDTRLRVFPAKVRQRHALAREAQLFGSVQKKYGFEQLIGSMQQVFLDRGVDANMVIVPADTAALLRCRQETRDFALNGALAQMYQIEPMRTIPSYTYNERFTLFEHRGMYVNQSGQRDSPMVRERSIGQFFVITKDDEYIEIIDHDNQRWHRITWRQAQGYANRGQTINQNQYRQQGGNSTYDEQPAQMGFGAQATAGAEAAPAEAAAPAQIDMGAVMERANWGERHTWAADRVGVAQELFGSHIDLTNKAHQAGFKALAKAAMAGKVPSEGVVAMSDVKAQAPAASQVLFGDTVTANGNFSNPANATVRRTKIVIFRPNVTFRMGAVVAGRGGEETGFTAFGNANFELSDEATTKTALGHYTCYFKPIVHTPRNLMVSPDAVFQGYLGGGGVKPYDDFESYAKNPYANRSGGGNDLVFMNVDDNWTCDGVLSSMGYGEQYTDLMDTCSSWGGNPDAAKAAMMNLAKHFEHINSTAGRSVTGENNEVPFAERRFGMNHICYQGTQLTKKNAGGLVKMTPARGHLHDCEFLDSSVREWSGHVSFRDTAIPVDSTDRAMKRDFAFMS